MNTLETATNLKDNKINGIKFYNQTEEPVDAGPGDFWVNGGEIKTFKEGGFMSLNAPMGSKDNPFISLSMLPISYEGLYWFKDNQGRTQELFCYDGFVLIASNNVKDSLFPTAHADKNNSNFRVDRNGTFGEYGEANPEKDYLIGDFINGLTFNKGRISTWGAGASTSHTWEKYKLSYTNVDTGTYSMTFTWNTNSLDDVTHKDNVTGVYRERSIHSDSVYFVLDSIRKDSDLDAGAGQSTIGGAGVKDSSGDPSKGCYTGHGGGDSKDEGNYSAEADPDYFTGYTTWIGA